jgi:hypothetical protein
LCHADLRPRREARSSATTVVPSSRPPVATAATPGPELGLDLSVLEPVALEFVEPEPDEPRGRHSRDAAPPASPHEQPVPGRHSHGRAGTSRSLGRSGPGRRSRTTGTVMDLEGVQIPTGDQVTAEQVDLVAEQMLTRLKLSEPQSRFLDPDDVPGGKWGIVAAGTVTVIVALLVVYTVLGLVFGG